MFSYRPKGSPRCAYVVEALRSLRAQVGVDIDMIIIDDGSPESLPRELISDTPTIKFYYERFPKNMGKAAAMDRGFDRMNERNPGGLGTTLHDDDYLPTSDSLLKRYKLFMGDDGGKGTAFVFTNAIYKDMIKKTSTILYDPKRVIQHRHDLLLKNNYVCGAAYLTRNEYLKKYRADRSLRHAEEYESTLAISRMARDSGLLFKYSPEPTAVYRIHAQQAWASAPKSRAERDRQYLNAIRDRYR